MKNLKNFIIFLIFILIIALIIFGVVMIYQKKGENPTPNPQPNEQTDLTKQIGVVKDYPTYFSVEKMLNNYIQSVYEQNKEALYCLLDNSYILENNLTLDNVLSSIYNITKYNSKAIITQMYGQQNNEASIYYIECMLEKEYNENKYYFALYMDNINNTYSVKPIDEKALKIAVNYPNDNLSRTEIKTNNYNKIVLSNPEEQEIATKYFESFLTNMLYYPEYAYTLIDREYKSEHFETYEDFNNYIEENKEKFLAYGQTLKTASDFKNQDAYEKYLDETIQFRIKEYQVKQDEDYTRYICIDNYNNYYVFYTKQPLNYTVMLDTYTIDSPEFIKQYETSSVQTKMILNIQKIVEALNKNDYSYVYGKLDEEYKETYFKTQEDFEKYAKETFDIALEIQFNKYEKIDDLDTYKVKLTGKNKTMTKRIIMQFGEGTDFTMSISMEQL